MTEINKQDRSRHVTVWSRSHTGQWVVERSYPLHYVQDVLGLGVRQETLWAESRAYAWFEQGENPNDLEKK
jgi:hypothetical protein